MSVSVSRSVCVGQCVSEQQEEVGVRKVCALFGVILRAGPGRLAGRGGTPHMCETDNCCAEVSLSLCSGGLSGTAQICASGKTPAPSQTDCFPELAGKLSLQY